MGEDSGERTKTLRNALKAKTCAGVGAGSMRVSSMLACNAIVSTYTEV